MNNPLSPSMPFTSGQMRVFIGTLLATFIVVALQLAGIKPPHFITPIPQKADTFFDVISPKLDRIPNSFELQRESAFIPKAQAAADYDEAAAYAVIDFTSGKVIAAKNLDMQLPIASLTKIMTAVVGLDLASPQDSFAVTAAAAAKIPTKIGVQVGEQLTLDEALHAAIMTSANDAAEVIRDGVERKYGERDFVRAMNEKAVMLGLSHSSFANPQGFDDPKNYSSVGDLAVLSHYALTNYPEIAAIAQLDYIKLPENASHRQFDLYNWNGLIGVYPATMGLKIGNTDAAGMTTIVLSNRGGRQMLAVVLGAPGIIKRDLWAAELLDVGYETVGLPAINITEEDLRAKYATWQYWN